MIFICNKDHVFLVEQQFNELNLNHKYLIIAEPFGKNTCPAITCASLQTELENDILVMPSDHVFDDMIFVESVNRGLELTNDGIVTFGIKPTYPETGYGYIMHDGNKLIKFVEKPRKDIAEKYLEAGNYLWNSGVFLFKNRIMIDELNRAVPDIVLSISETLKLSKVNGHIIHLNEKLFDQVRSESIDYAVMEHYLNGRIVPYHGYWSDIGSYESLHKHLSKDQNNNYIDGDIVSIDTSNCLIKSEKRLVTTLGIDNLIIISDADSLLIADKNRSQDVKLIVKKLEESDRQETTIHAKAFRPWGYYINIEGNDYSGFKVKRIVVYPSKKLSLQYHNKRSEHWTIIKGTVKVQVGEDQHLLHKNQSIYIPVGVQHRIENVGDDLVEFIETQIGDYLGEDDIVRIEDDFGRV
jgi:mannose-1-phosphate guanylyltransferase/mannose-6-phosphate isomerase